MAVAVITGALGLVGSECVEFFSRKGYLVVGIDNDLRAHFFGPDGSNRSQESYLKSLYKSYDHRWLDVRDEVQIDKLFSELGGQVKVIVHAAAQPSHDWAKSNPKEDFSINAIGTLNLLEAYRKYSRDAKFVFLSTNKIYGDRVNSFHFTEYQTRWDLPKESSYFFGIDEEFSIDQTQRSLFGVSKSSADLMVQEYGRYFGLCTAIFRAGCITGGKHQGVPLHGYLSYLIKSVLQHKSYQIIGHKGKQVRDILHSYDLVSAISCFLESPKTNAVYNIGGGRENNCSILEAISMIENRIGFQIKVSYQEEARQGDHQWWITNLSKFRNDYPDWSLRYNLEEIIDEIISHYSGKK